MGAINRDLGQAIRSRRQKLCISQAHLADVLTQVSGSSVRPSTVSAWERGSTLIPAEMMHYICQALRCTSYSLFPHSSTVSARDLELIGLVSALPDREKDILHYLLTSWPGDSSALWEFGLLYGVLPTWCREDIAHVGILAYRDALSCGEPIDTRVTVDLPAIIKAWEKLK